MRKKLLDALKHSGNHKLEQLFVGAIKATKEHQHVENTPKEQK